MRISPTPFIWGLLCLIGNGLASPNFSEQLYIRPLPQDALLASLAFRSNETVKDIEKQNFRYFPRSIAQILQHTHTKELHLRFNLGRWDSEKWGERPWHGRREGGTGVELWAWIDASVDELAFARWLTLTNALSGLFCASLNFIDSTKTIRPAILFEPEGHHSNTTGNGLRLLHGNLPHEVVCTENLTPFLKLLPCQGKAGISSLLDGHTLFDSSWQSMAVVIKPLYSPNEQLNLIQIEQTVDMVLDIERSKRPRGNPIPRPLPIEDIECDTSKHYSSEDSCFPLAGKQLSSWSLSEVFGRLIKGTCSPDLDLENGSTDICLQLSDNISVEAVSDESYQRNKQDNGILDCFKTRGDNFDLLFTVRPRLNATEPMEAGIHAARSFTGYGQERGGVQLVVTNPSWTTSAEIVYMESLPWFMRPYMHTLNSVVSSLDATSDARPSRFEKMFYRPALDRHRGTHLELQLSVPPRSKLTVTYFFDKAILRYTEYPPDANRGFDVAPAVIRLLDSKGDPKPKFIRTTSLLLPLPTPDFSMPYNVIILTSTVMALGFGSVFNLIVRRFVAADEVEKKSLSTLRRAVELTTKLVLGSFTRKSAKTD